MGSLLHHALGNISLCIELVHFRSANQLPISNISIVSKEPKIVSGAFLKFLMFHQVLNIKISVSYEYTACAANNFCVKWFPLLLLMDF